jgi:hypothetical protein
MTGIDPPQTSSQALAEPYTLASVIPARRGRWARRKAWPVRQRRSTVRRSMRRSVVHTRQPPPWHSSSTATQASRWSTTGASVGHCRSLTVATCHTGKTALGVAAERANALGSPNRGRGVLGLGSHQRPMPASHPSKKYRCGSCCGSCCGLDTKRLRHDCDMPRGWPRRVPHFSCVQLVSGRFPDRAVLPKISAQPFLLLAYRSYRTYRKYRT